MLHACPSCGRSIRHGNDYVNNIEIKHSMNINTWVFRGAGGGGGRGDRFRFR